MPLTKINSTTTNPSSITEGIAKHSLPVQPDRARGPILSRGSANRNVEGKDRAPQTEVS
jgi:hypothetical protein